MDFEQDFLETTAATLQTMKRKNKPVSTWSADDGSTVEGWAFRYMERTPTSHGTPGQGWYDATWGRTEWILATDGRFWAYYFHGTEEYNQPTKLQIWFGELGTEILVGSEGKPFSKVKSELERLPYK